VLAVFCVVFITYFSYYDLHLLAVMSEHSVFKTAEGLWQWGRWGNSV